MANKKSSEDSETSKALESAPSNSGEIASSHTVIGPQTNAIRAKFSRQRIPLEQDFADLINIADVGRRAVGRSPDQVSAGPGDGLQLLEDGKLAVGFVETDLEIRDGKLGIRHKWPVGTIIMYSGLEKDVPKGWVICDGRDNRAPDLRDKFVLAAGPNNAQGTSKGKVGPEGAYPIAVEATVAGGDISVVVESTKLTEGHIPSHRHRTGPMLSYAFQKSAVADALAPYDYAYEKAKAVISHVGVVVAGGGDQAGMATLTNSVGDGEPHSHSAAAKLEGKSHTHAAAATTPYYALLFIMYTG